MSQGFLSSARTVMALLIGWAGAMAAVGAAEATPPRPIFALNSLDADVSMIDPSTWKVVKRIPTGKQPHHLYLSPDGRSLLVANALANSLTLIDPLTGDVQRTISRIPDPYQLAFSPDMKWFVTAANRLNHIGIYRAELNDGGLNIVPLKTLPAGRTPSHIRFDSKSTVAYVTLQDSDQLTAIDLATQTPRWTVSVGKMPADVFLTPDDKTALIGLTGEDAVEAWDLGASPPRRIKRIPTGDGAHAFRAQGDGRHVFVSNRAGDSISRIDLQTLNVTQTFAAPGGPDCMELLADGRTLLVTARWARKLRVIDTQTGQQLRQVDLGNSPHGVWTLDHAPVR